MSVKSEIERLSAIVANAFSAIGDKGGIVADGATSRNLETAIRSISTSSGMYAFQIDENSHLICVYDTQEAPLFSVDDRGHLLFEYEKTAPPMEIDENGHLMWTLEE